ncbi:MAG: hypothetical protein KAX49_07400 [Halanaerobiales bacterium]|nr:hypothetical protein [Halanaerobiales bacterium]
MEKTIKEICDERDYINQERTPRDYYYHTAGYSNCQEVEVEPLKQKLDKIEEILKKYKKVNVEDTIKVIQFYKEIDQIIKGDSE